MGRIKITLVKRTGAELVEKCPEMFKADFEHNKKAVPEIINVNSKKLRNVIAGHVTKIMKKAKAH